MLVNGCCKQITLLTLLLLIDYYANCLPKERENRHLFPLLGYLHGYKIGQSFAYQLPPFILSPVVILPSVNQQQSVNVQKSTSGENYQENGGTFQIISPSKLVSSITEAYYKDNEREIAAQKVTSINDIFKKLDLSTTTSLLNNDHDTFKQNIASDIDVTTEISAEIGDEAGDKNVTPITDVTITETITEMDKLKVTTKAYGPYSNAGYKNENISTLSITNAPLDINSTSLTPLIQCNQTLPKIEFSLKFRPENKKYESLNTTGETSSLFRGYSYRDPWYNSIADTLSKTTKNNESPLPLAYNDRWQNFSSLWKSYPTTGEFRPLAGLYHDGFLNKDLIKKTGFVPINSKYRHFN